jgi:RNA polymerase primary sigma factor
VGTDAYKQSAAREAPEGEEASRPEGVAAVNGFNHPALKQLTDQQVRYAPPARRLEQRARAEKLLTEIEAEKQYPYQFICYRVTDFRPDSYPGLLIPGTDVRHDLALMIEALAVPGSPATEVVADGIVTLEEVSRQLNVSTKTIRRWRALGLVGSRVYQNGRTRVAFDRTVVDRFLAAHSDRVLRGSRFSQLSEEEREEVVRRARRLARAAGGTLTEVSRRIARKLGRSAETVRYTIKNFDREHPDQALFPALTDQLDAAAKETIYSSYRRGTNVDTLAKKFQRTRNSMYRVINEVRAQRLLEQPLDYIPHPSFADAANEADILAPMPEADAYDAKRQAMRAPKDVPPELASQYEWPLLSKDQEQHLFRQMNYLKYKAARLRDGLRKGGDAGAELDPSRVRIESLKRIEDLQREANVVKDHLIKANMRLVTNIAKRHVAQSDNFFELLSDGNMSLIRAVEKFDFGRGFKFSTYASWAIMKNFARSIPDERHRRERFVTGHEEVFEVAPDNRTDEHEIVASQERATHSVNRLLEYLEPREREIIRMRAGLDDHAKGMTLEEIGQQFGITKERVRQLNARAMKKLRTIAEEQELDLS